MRTLSKATEILTQFEILSEQAFTLLDATLVEIPQFYLEQKTIKLNYPVQQGHQGTVTALEMKTDADGWDRMYARTSTGQVLHRQELTIPTMGRLTYQLEQGNYTFAG